MEKIFNYWENYKESEVSISSYYFGKTFRYFSRVYFVGGVI